MRINLPANQKLGRLRHALAISVTLMFLCVLGLSARAGTVKWDGGGGDSNWSTADNWDTDSVPGSGDDVVFDTTSDTAVVDGSFGGTINSLSINSGFGGTVQMNRSLTINAGLDVNTATLDANNNSLSIAGATSQSGGTFRTGTAVMDFDSDGSGDGVTISGGTFIIESDDTTNDINTPAGSWDNTGGTIRYLNAGSNTNILSALSAYNHLTINSSITYSLDGNITVNGNFTLNGGTFDAAGNNLTIDGATNQNGGTFKTGQGVMDFDADGSGNNVTISSGTMEIESDDTTNDINTPAGSWNNQSGTTIKYLNAGSNTNVLSALSPYEHLVVNSTITYTVDGAITVNANLDVNGGTLTLNGDVDANKNINMNGGTFDADTNNITLAGDWTNSATFTPGSSLVTVDGGNGGTITTGGNNFNDLTLNGTGTWNLQDNLGLNGSLDVQSGELNGNGNNVTINGNYSQSGGTFSTGTGVIDFDADGSGDTVSISGGTLEIESDDTTTDIDFPAGSWSNSGGTISYTVPKVIIFQDGFEDGTLTDSWTVNNPDGGDAAICTDPDLSGSNSVYLRGGSGSDDYEVEIVTGSLDLSSYGAGEISVWIKRGDDNADCGSEDPDTDEDLTVQYLNDSGTWQTLNTYAGDGTVGQTYEPTFSVPADGFHSNFKLRFRHLYGGSDIDYWHIDDVKITGLSSGTNTKILSASKIPPYNNLNVNSPSTTYTLNGNLDVDGNITLDQGTMDADSSNNFNINLAGSWTNNGGTFLPRNGIFYFDGTSSETITSGGSSFNDFEINNGGTLTLQDALDVNGYLKISSGTLDVNSSGNYTVSVAGDFTNLGTFEEQLGRLELDGSGQTISSDSGKTTLFELVKTVSSGTDTLTFDSSSILEVLDRVKLHGASNTDHLTLTTDDTSTPTQAQFFLATDQKSLGPDGIEQDLLDLTVTYIDSSGESGNGALMVPDSSSPDPGGSNDNWDFNAGTTIKWEGTYNNDWDRGRNWDEGKPPRSNDDAVILAPGEDTRPSSGTSSPQIDSTDPEVKTLDIHSGAMLTTVGRNLVINNADGVADPFINDGTFRLNGGETVTDGASNPVAPKKGDPSTIVYRGTGFYDIKSNWNYDNLKIAGDQAANGRNGRFYMTADETLTGNLTISSGILDANGNNLSINGDTTMNGGWFKTGTGTITFGDASGDTVSINSGILAIEQIATSSDIVVNTDTWNNASGSTVSYTNNALFDNFDSGGLDTDRWVSDANGTSDNCTAVSGNGMFFNQSNSGSITTQTLDVDDGGTISFYMKIWDSGDTSCGGGDMDSGKDIVLEYSVDEGSSWNNLQTYSHTAAPSLTQFTYNFSSSDAEATPSTQFRWRQTGSDAAGEDTWALDNVAITTNTSGVTSNLLSSTTLPTSTYDNLLVFSSNSSTYTMEDPITANSNIAIARGTMDVSGSNYSITISGNWQNFGGFEARNGAVTFNSGVQRVYGGGSGVGKDDGTKDFYDLTVTGDVLRLDGAELEVKSTLTINDSRTVEMNGYDMDLNGTLSNDGTLQRHGDEAIEIGTMDTDSGLVKYVGDNDGSSETFSNAIPELGGGGNADYYNLEINDTATNNDTFQLGNADIKVLNNLDVRESTLDTAGNTLHVDDGTTGDGNNDATIYENATLKVSSSGTLNVTRDVTVQGTSSNSGTVTVNGTSNVTRDLTVKSDGQINVNSTTDVDRHVTINNGGTIDVTGSPTIFVEGNWTNSVSGTFNAGSGTVEFDGSSGGPFTITTRGDPFYDLRVNGSSVTWEIQDDTQVKNSLDVNSGTLKVTYIDTMYKTFTEDFESSLDSSKWPDSSGSYRLSCNPHTGSYQYFFDSDSAARYIETRDLNLTNTSSITYWLWLDNNDCGDEIDDDDDIQVQYSTDGGSTWNDINQFNPSSLTRSKWHKRTPSLPAGAKTKSTRIRWDHVSFLTGGTTYDNWGIDDVSIDYTEKSSGFGLRIGTGSGSTRSVQIGSGGTLELTGNSNGRAVLTTIGSDPSSRDRMDFHNSGSIDFDKARVYYLGSDGIEFRDESAIGQLNDVVFNFGTDGGGTGQYLNFDASTNSTYEVTTPQDTGSGAAVFRDIDFRNALDKSGLHNANAKDKDGNGAVDFLANDGSTGLSENAIKFIPIAGDLAGEDNDLEVSGNDRIRWGQGAALRQNSSGDVEGKFTTLQQAINSASSGDVITQDGNHKFAEDIDLENGPGDITMRDVMVAGDIDNTNGSESNKLNNVVVFQDADAGTESIGASNPINTVNNCMVVDGSVNAGTANNCVTIDTDGSGGHSISGTVNNSETNVVDTAEEALVAYWPLDQGYGTTAYDRSANSNHGTMNNMDPSTDWVSGSGTINFYNPHALDFDGSGEHVKTNYNGIGASGQSFTISLWINTSTSLDGKNYFFITNYVDKDKTGFIGIGSDDESQGMFFWLRDDSGTNVAKTGYHTPAFDGNWHHYTGVRDIGADEVRFYIDGTLQETISTTNTNAVRDADSFFGLMRHFERDVAGRVDDVRLYNRVLSDQEISILSNGNRASKRLFQDVSNRDFHLKIQEGMTASDHHLIDGGTSVDLDGSGSTSNDTDFDGNVREDIDSAWDIGPDEYSSYADPETRLSYPKRSNQNWTEVGELEKIARGAAQCFLVPYVKSGVGYVDAYSVDVDGENFGYNIGTLNGSGEVSGDTADRFGDLYLSRFWHNEWSNPGYRYYATIDTNGNSDPDKLYAFRHVDTTSGDGRNVDTMIEDPDWSGPKDITGAVSNADLGKISVKLNDQHLYVVDGYDGTIYKVDTSNGSVSASNTYSSSGDFDADFFHLPQTWNDNLIAGVVDGSNELVRVDGSVSSTGNTFTLGGSGRANHRLNIHNIKPGRSVYGTAAGQPHVWNIKSDNMTQNWESFDVESPARSFPMVFPGIDFVWGTSKDHIFKVTRSDGTKPADWGTGKEWPLKFPGKTLRGNYDYWPFRDLMFVATEDGHGYFVNAVMGSETIGDAASATGEEDGSVVTGWPYVFPNRKIHATKLFWDGDWNFHVAFVVENKSTGNFRIISFPLP